MNKLIGKIVAIQSSDNISLIKVDVEGDVFTPSNRAMKVSLSSVVMSTTFSLVIGMVFGLWPAYQASQLNPIEALRYE